MANTKGARREREFVNLLDDLGYEVIRSPASGSGTGRDQPDVLFGDGEVLFVVELKSSGGDPIYLNGEEVDVIRRVADGFGGIPRIGVKFDEKNGDPTWGSEKQGFYLLKPDDCHVTPGGNVRVKKETAFEKGVLVEDL